MSVHIEMTPNPNALKFTVGVDVGEPKTFNSDTAQSDPLATALLGLTAVISVFMTADFVTLTKSDDGNWDVIAPKAETILTEHFG